MRIRTDVALAVATLAVGIGLWGSHQVVVADQAHYITSGTNLVRGLGFTNPAGQPEIWFPPLYPLAIGLVALATGDAFVAAKLVSLLASVVWVIAVYRTGRALGHERAALIAAGLLVLQPERASFSVLSMSQGLFSALMWSAIAVHVSDADDRRRATAPVTGILFGLASLTRPEALLPALLVAADRGLELWRRSTRRAAARTAVMLGCMALIVAPYSLYLFRTTGSFSPTGKSEVNLAIGRSVDSGEPAYRIDPSTNDVVTNPGRGGWRDLVRYSRFLQREVGMLGVMLDVAGAIWLGLGCWLLIRARSGRCRVLLWAAAPLAVIPFYVPVPAYLAPFLPALVLAAAVGIAHVWNEAASPDTPPGVRRVAAAVLIATIGWTAASDAHTLVHYYTPGREPVAERLCGEWLARTASPADRVTAVGGTIAYYAGVRWQYLTGDPLPQVVAYMRAQGIRYLGVGTRDRPVLHPTVAGLLDGAPASGVRLVHATAAPDGAACRVFVLDESGR